MQRLFVFALFLLSTAGLASASAFAASPPTLFRVQPTYV